MSLFKVTYHGTYNLTSEEFTHGNFIRVNDTSTDPNVCLPHAVAFLQAILFSPITGLGTVTDVLHGYHNIVRWDQVHIAEWSLPLNQQVGPGIHVSNVQVGAVSTVGTLPYQISPCVTLVTGTDPGLRRKRNRFYLPSPVLAVINNNNSKIAQPFVAAVCQGVKTGNANINLISPSGNLAVYSGTDHVDNPVTETYMDDVWDTQRRRRRSLIGTRTIVTMV